jgi:hypothetical protein
MPLVVLGVAVVIDRVDAVDVLHVAVAVIVDPVAGNLERLRQMLADRSG